MRNGMISGIESDPEFRKFTPEQQARILADAKASPVRKPAASPSVGPVRTTKAAQLPSPLPVHDALGGTMDGYPMQPPRPAAPAAPKVPHPLQAQYLQGKARQIPQGMMAPPTIGQNIVTGLQEGFEQNMTGGMMSRAAQNIQAGAARPMSRAIDYDTLIPPKPAKPGPYLTPAPPSFTQQAESAAKGLMSAMATSPAAHLLAADMQNLEADVKDWGTYGHGLAAGGGAAVGVMADPAAMLPIAPALRASNLVQAGAGAMVGVGEAAMRGDTEGLGLNILTNAALGIIPGPKARPKAAPAAPLTVAEGVQRLDPATYGQPKPEAPAVPLSDTAPAAAPDAPPRRLGDQPHPWGSFDADTQALLAHANDLQKAAPVVAAERGGRRTGSIRVGRTPADTWTPAQQAANAGIERKIRELVREARDAEANGNPARMQEIAAHIQALDDARVVIPKPGAAGHVTTIADLTQLHASHVAAGDTTRATQVQRQITRMRASNYHNERKYDFMSPESQDKFNTLLEQHVAESWAAGRDPRTPVPFATLRRQAEDILPRQLEQIARKGLKQGESLTGAEYEAAKNYMQQLVEESVVVEQRVNAIRAAQNGGPVALDPNGQPIAHGDLHAAEVIESTRQMQLEKDVTGLLDIVTQSRSQKGRDLAYLKIVAQQSWDTSYWLARANRTAGGVATNQNISAISGVVVRGQQAEAAFRAAEAAGDSAAMAAAEAAQREARIDLAKEMGRISVTPWTEALLAARKAGLLSGAKTIARNATSNSINMGLEEIVNVIGSAPDAFLGMWTGRRTTFAREAANIGRGFVEAGTRGIREALETQIHGMPLDQLAALEIPREINTPNRTFNNYVNHIMRFQGAQDRLFKAYALRRSLDSQARSLALEAARGGTPNPQHPTIQAHIQYLADNPTEQMMCEAVADAEFATFQNDTAISKGIGAFKQAMRNWDNESGFGTGRAINTGIDLIMPFTKTPAAIGTRVLDFAVGTGTIQAVRKRGNRIRGQHARNANMPNHAEPVDFMTAAEQKAISRGLGRQAIGATLIWAGQRMFEQGLLTGTDQMDRREENNAVGRTSNAVKIRGQWVPLNPFSPVGNLLTLGATFARDGEPDSLNQAAQTGMQIFALMLDQPFTQGAKQFVEVAGDTSGRKGKRLFGSIAGSVMPTLGSEVAQFLDPSEAGRAVDYSGFGSAMAQSLQARTPIWRNSLPEKSTALGDDQDSNNGWRAFAAGAGRFAREDRDPIAHEVIRTNATLPRLEDSIPMGRDNMGRETSPVPLTPQEQQQYLRGRGNVARSAVGGRLADPFYQGMESQPDEQTDALNHAITQAVNAYKRRYQAQNQEAFTARRDNQTDADRARRGRGRAVVAPFEPQR